MRIVSALLRPVRGVLRLCALLALVVAGLAIVSLLFPALGRARRERIVSGWSRMLVRSCGVTLRECPGEGATTLSASTPGKLLLLNHVSWLDVFAVLSLAPVSFVAKSEIARWPLLGTLVSRAGTLFLDRGRRHAVRRMNHRVAALLEEGRCVAVFAEGTTSDGAQLRPFHGNLVEGALRAHAPVIPVGLRYLDASGRRSDAPVFTSAGALVTSVVRIVFSTRLVAEVHPLAPVEGTSRTEVAERARRAIGERLRLPLDDRIPERVLRVRQSSPHA